MDSEKTPNPQLNKLLALYVELHILNGLSELINGPKSLERWFFSLVS